MDKKMSAHMSRQARAPRKLTTYILAERKGKVKMDPEIKTITLTCYEYDRYVRMTEKVAVISIIIGKDNDEDSVSVRLLREIIGEI